MALEYQLLIATDLDAGETLARLAREGGLALSADHAAGDGFVARAAAESALGRSIVRQALGFEPSVCITLRVAGAGSGIEPDAARSKEGVPPGVRAAVRAALALLRALPDDDAALLFNGETTLLLRPGGRPPVLDDAGDFWSPALISLAGAAHDRRALPLL